MPGPKIMPGAQSELDYFMDIPWCCDQFLHDNAVAVPRLDQESDGRGSTGRLFSQTLNTPGTISHRIVLYHDPTTKQNMNPESRKYWLPVETCSVFYALGEDVCGFRDICHGGIQATLLDDVAGVLGILNARLQDGIIPTRVPRKCSPETNPGMLDFAKNLIATQNMQVEYFRPLRVPAVIQVTADLKEISDDGSSFVLHGVIRDGRGKEYAAVKTTWVVLRPRGKL